MAVDLEVDLTEVLTAELGPPGVRIGAGPEPGWWVCPFHYDGNPSLKITPDGRHFKCHGCGEGGDAIDFLRKLHNLSFGEAVKRLRVQFSSSWRTESRGSRVSRVSRCSRINGGSLLSTLNPDPVPGWQQGAREIVNRSKRTLWQSAGAPGLEMLRRRGLKDRTIKRYRLGWCVPYQFKPQWRRYLREGLTIPWFSGRTLRAVRFRGVRGYGFLRESVTGVFYPSRSFPLPGPVLICEGELDALLAIQEVGDLVQVGTLGSASMRPTAEALAALVLTPKVLLAYDADDAGDQAAEFWQNLLATNKGVRVRPPEGRDLTDVHQENRGGLRRWIENHLRRIA